MSFLDQRAQREEHIKITPISIRVEPYIKLANQQPIFWNKISAKIKIRNVGEHKADLSIDLFGSDANIYLDGRRIDQINFVGPTAFDVSKDASIEIKLEKDISPSFAQAEALNNIFREHGPNIEKYLKEQHQIIFAFGTDGYTGLTSNCSLSWSEAEKQVRESNAHGFGITINSDEGFRQNCYLLAE